MMDAVDQPLVWTCRCGARNEIPPGIVYPTGADFCWACGADGAEQGAALDLFKRLGPSAGLPLTKKV